jgi:hypothetical protein
MKIIVIYTSILRVMWIGILFLVMIRIHHVARNVSKIMVKVVEIKSRKWRNKKMVVLKTKIKNNGVRNAKQRVPPKIKIMVRWRKTIKNMLFNIPINHMG